MGHLVFRGLAVAGSLVLVAGCASLPPARGTADVDRLIAERGAPAPTWPAADRHAANDSAQPASPDDWAEPLTLERAVKLAFQRNPKVRETYAELGLAQADVLEAASAANPTLSYATLDPKGGGPGKITRGISIGFTDLLLFPLRSRLARTTFESTRDRVGAELLDLQGEVETAWFEYASSLQVAEMRNTVALAADSSAEYARRLHDAGNLSERELSQHLAAASEARIDAVRAKADSLRARTELSSLVGISSRDGWQVPARLPAPPATDGAPTDIADRALAYRLDLSATRREIRALEGGLRLTRRWRWLGDLELGYESESEPDGARFDGPTFALRLPIFSRNADGVLRARAQLESAQARLSHQELAVRNDVALGLDRLAATREIAEGYRTALLPLRETIVQRSQEETNFMLIGAFELLQARREEFDAYQEYLEAVRDYWVARVQLRLAAGGRLPGDEAASGATLGVEEILKPAAPPMDHSKMDHSTMDHSTMHHEAAPDAELSAPKNDGDPK